LKKTIAITLGDVAGIGPEVVQKALRSGKLDRQFHYEVIFASAVPKVTPGRSSKISAFFAWTSLESAVTGCLQRRYAAVVTGPVSKASLRAVGFNFPGQTEWFAFRTKTKKFAMMLVGGNLRVSLVTIHEPLRKVSSLLTQQKIATTLELTRQWLIQYGIKRPRIFVAALNPHGGVPSEAGSEEKRIITPAVKHARKKFGNQIVGPLSADHLFWAAHQGEADAVICMYHDQGLIPLKMLAFDSGVNVTLGLPIIRTSPDHGTAFDIAGKNRANPQSMIAAINLAATLAANAD
jgi:4-hydroxythreonine-4-phosphate dehydrogenase